MKSLQGKPVLRSGTDMPMSNHADNVTMPDSAKECGASNGHIGNPDLGTENEATLLKREAGVLEQYTAHSLEDLDGAQLMNRIDSKFVVPRQLLPDLLLRMQPHYSALEIGTKRCFRYLNTYYDSDEFSHYLAHHNGRLNRYKVRRRTYLDSETSFLEVKFKNNKKRTLKSRVPLPGQQPLTQASSEAASEFLAQSGVLNHNDLKPVQMGSYSRIALAHEARCERLTIDCNLAFHDMAENRRYTLGPWIVLELKQARLNRSSPFFTWARETGMRKSSFSKYCMGVYFTGSRALKRNNFHSIARQMQINLSQANVRAIRSHCHTGQSSAQMSDCKTPADKSAF